MHPAFPSPTKEFQQISCPLVSSWRTDQHRAPPSTGYCLAQAFPLLIPQGRSHRVQHSETPLPTVHVRDSMACCTPPSTPGQPQAPPDIPMASTFWPPLFRSGGAPARFAPPADSPSGVPGGGPRGGGREHLQWTQSRIQLLLKIDRSWKGMALLGNGNVQP